MKPENRKRVECVLSYSEFDRTDGLQAGSPEPARWVLAWLWPRFNSTSPPWVHTGLPSLGCQKPTTPIIILTAVRQKRNSILLCSQQGGALASNSTRTRLFSHRYNPKPTLRPSSSERAFRIDVPHCPPPPVSPLVGSSSPAATGVQSHQAGQEA